MKRPKKKRKGSKRKPNMSGLKRYWAKMRAKKTRKKTARKNNARKGKGGKARRPNPPRSIERAKTGKWYKGPHGVRIRVRRKRGGLLVDVRK